MKRFPLGLLLAGWAFLTAGRSSGTPANPKAHVNPHTGRPIVTRGDVRLSDETLRALVVATGFADVEKAIALANRESGRYPQTVLDTRGMSVDELREYWGFTAHPELSVGLWQINLLANAALVPGATLDEKIAALQDPATNARVAMRLSQGGTMWRPWGG